MDKIELENKIHNKPVTMTFLSKSGKFCVRNGIAEMSQHPNTIIVNDDGQYASACVENIVAIRGKESKGISITILFPDKRNYFFEDNFKNRDGFQQTISSK